MITVIGIIFIVFGGVCILWGDRDLKVKGGIILKTFSWPSGYTKWIKWPMGIALIYAGLKIIFHA